MCQVLAVTVLYVPSSGLDCLICVMFDSGRVDERAKAGGDWEIPKAWSQGVEKLEGVQVAGLRLGGIGEIVRLGGGKPGREYSRRSPGSCKIPGGVEGRERISRTLSERNCFGNRFAKHPLKFFNLF